jgi:hypothetical protein
LLASVIVCALSLWVVDSAHAGTYVVEECHSSNDHTAVADPVYQTNGSLAFTPGTLCTSSVAPGVAIGTQGSFSGPLQASWAFFAPPGAYINGVNLQRHQNSSGGYSAEVAVCGSVGCNGYFDNTSQFAATQFGAGGWTSFFSLLQCGPGACDSGGFVYMNELQFTMLDAASPTITSLEGTLMASGPRRGSETLTIAASDQGSGVREARVRVNGSEVGPRPQSSCAIWSDGTASRLRPCGSANYSLTINTDAAPWVDGTNVLEVCAYDFAMSGTPNVGCVQRTVETDNSCPSSGGTAPATELRAGLEKQGNGDVRPSIYVRSTRGAALRGQLASGSGPVGNANICVYEKIDLLGDVRQLVQTAKTRSDGIFAVQLPPGPSRLFDVVYRYNNQLVQKEQLYLDSSVVPTFRLGPKGGLSNGENAHFSGLIPGPNADGRAISLQARTGKKWRTFKQLRTDDKGRYKGRYRFTQTHGRALYTFRALVKRQGGYPYSPGSSKKKKIVVRG